MCALIVPARGQWCRISKTATPLTRQMRNEEWLSIQGEQTRAFVMQCRRQSRHGAIVGWSLDAGKRWVSESSEDPAFLLLGGNKQGTRQH